MDDGMDAMAGAAGIDGYVADGGMAPVAGAQVEAVTLPDAVGVSSVLMAPGLDPELAGKELLAQRMDDLLRLTGDEILGMASAEFAALVRSDVPPHLHDRMACWAPALRDQAWRARHVRERLQAGGTATRVRVCENLLDQLARREWSPRLSLRRFLHAVLPQNLRPPYALRLDQPEQAKIQVGTPRHPHHIVITLGRRDFLRFIHQHAAPWRWIDPTTRRRWEENTWQGGCNLPSWNGQVTILAQPRQGDFSPEQRRYMEAHEESHALDGLFGVMGGEPRPRDSTKSQRIRWHRRLQQVALKTEIIAYLTEPSARTPLQNLGLLVDPHRYSNHLWYAVNQWTERTGDRHVFPQAWLTRHHHTLVQALQAADVVLQFPQGDHLLRLTDMAEWPRLAGQVVAAGLHPATRAGGFPPASMDVVALLQRIHPIMGQLNRQTELLRQGIAEEGLPEDAQLTTEDWAIVHWVQGMALDGARLYLDEEALLQALQHLRAAWLAVHRDKIPEGRGMDIGGFFGPRFADRGLARQIRRAYEAFFQP
jgi:hypothetical protein